MITAYLYAIGFVLNIVLFFHFLKSYKEHKNIHILDYAFCFFSLSITCAAYSLPAIFFSKNQTLLAWSYIVASGAIFMLLFFCLRVLLLITNTFLKKNYRLFQILILLSGVIVVALHIIDMPKPVVTELSILWNANAWAGNISAVVGFSFGVMWTYLFYNISKMLTDIEARTKMLMFSVNGAMQGISTLFLFNPYTEFRQIVALLFVVVPGILSSMVFLILTKDISKGHIFNRI